jgi:tetraacyldisaccharide 4'-kinase
MTAGGTGKTPLVEWVLQVLVRLGMHPAVVSRGYGRASKGVVVVADRTQVVADARQGGDEPVQIARKFPGIPVVVGERRVDAALAAVRKCGADVIVSDDGFQHRRLHRDLDVVVVTGARALAREPMIPAGLRREPLRGLRRAHVIAISGAEEPDDGTTALQAGFAGSIVRMRRSIASVGDFANAVRYVPDRLQGLACYAFCGIGSPDRFFDDLRKAGARLVGERPFRDHHPFTRDELGEIVRAARAVGAKAVITTEKDAIRLDADRASTESLFAGVPLLYPILAISVDPPGVLEDRIATIAGVQG